MLSGLAGCAVQQGAVYVKDGKTYGVTTSRTWRERWWNYYERGSSYAEGDFWTEAIPDLQEAIKQRPADQRRARTYGFHFLDYFPHRELGVIYYRQARYDEAIRELETSLRSVDTSKAKFYLNKARRGQLEQAQREVAPPRLIIEAPADGQVLRQLTVTIRGRAESAGYVSALSLHGKTQFIELAEPSVAFERDVPLRDGRNTLELVAVDLLGHLTRQQLTVTLDRQGPLVTVSQVARMGGSTAPRVLVDGALSDPSGVVRFTLAGRAMTLAGGQEGTFREEIPLVPQMASLPFEAEDAAGNITRGDIALTTDLPTQRQGAVPRWWRWAAVLRLPTLAGWSQALHRPLGTVYPVPAAWHTSSLRLAQSGGAAPVIKFKNLAAQQTTYYDAVYLDGQVSAGSPLAALTLNGESLLRREAQQVFFGYNAALQPGDNRFVLEATDKAGNTAKQEVTVQRKEAAIARLDARLRLSLIPLEQKGDTATLAPSVYDQLLSALVNQERFQIVEREQLEAILREQKLSQSALVDPSTAAKVGKIAAADAILIGSVTETPNALEVFTRFVDVETAEILAAEDIYGEGLTLGTVGPLMEGLALKLRQRFPLLQGLVVKTEGKKVFFDLGKKQVKKSMKVLVFREGEALKHPVTGQVLGAPTDILGEAKVDAVFDDLSQGTLRQAQDAGEVKPLDKVIIK